MGDGVNVVCSRDGQCVLLVESTSVVDIMLRSWTSRLPGARKRIYPERIYSDVRPKDDSRLPGGHESSQPHVPSVSNTE